MPLEKRSRNKTSVWLEIEEGSITCLFKAYGETSSLICVIVSRLESSLDIDIGSLLALSNSVEKQGKWWALE